MTTPTAWTINVPLMHGTLEHIEAHPEELDSAKWHCGTRYCFAGHAAILSGAVFVTTHDDPLPDSTIHVLGPGGGEPLLVDHYAAVALGLDLTEWHLFNASNTLDDLRRIVADLTARAAS